MEPHSEPFLVFDNVEGVNKFVIGKNEHLAPSFIPEVKGPEDVHVLLSYSSFLDEANPIFVPAHRWSQLLTSFSKTQTPEQMNVKEFIKKHSIIYYEPPELFRYALPKNLVTYALKGDRSRARIFNKALRSGDEESAIATLPFFYRPFLKRQMISLYKDDEYATLPPSRQDERPRVDSGWYDPDIDQGYDSHITNLIVDAMKMPNATIIPTVPALMRSSDSTIIKQIRRINKLTELQCKRLSPISLVSKIIPYFHLYLDYGVIAGNSTQDYNTAIDILQRGLNGGDYSGVAITLSGYKDVYNNGETKNLIRFVTDVVNIAEAQTPPLPVIFPRSGWFGLRLTDKGIHGFGSLLNGNPRYMRGVVTSAEDKFGKTAIIDVAKDFSLPDLISNFLNPHGQVPSVAGLPNRPTQEALDNDKIFRKTFSKPLRLIHCEEARRIRKAQVQGVRNPAERYFEKSDHPLLQRV